MTVAIIAFIISATVWTMVYACCTKIVTSRDATTRNGKKGSVKRPWRLYQPAGSELKTCAWFSFPILSFTRVFYPSSLWPSTVKLLIHTKMAEIKKTKSPKDFASSFSFFFRTCNMPAHIFCLCSRLHDGRWDWKIFIAWFILNTHTRGLGVSAVRAFSIHFERTLTNSPFRPSQKLLPLLLSVSSFWFRTRMRW